MESEPRNPKRKSCSWRRLDSWCLRFLHAATEWLWLIWPRLRWESCDEFSISELELDFVGIRAAVQVAAQNGRPFRREGRQVRPALSRRIGGGVCQEAQAGRRSDSDAAPA